MINKNQILIGVAVLAVLVTGALIFVNSSGNDFLSFLNPNQLKPKDIAKKSVEYLNNNVLKGQTAKLIEFSRQSGVIKIKIDINGTQYNSYATTDGKLFFPEALEMSSAQGNTAEKSNSGGDIKQFNITEANHVRGNFSAPVTLVEFSDFECPFCKSHLPTLDRILKDYKDSVRLVYKHFPLTSIHPNAQKAAEASECASEQGKFWEYHDLLFEKQAGGLSIEKYKQWAVQLGLNSAKFNGCLDSSKYADKVSADSKEGSGAGVSGTPATFINGKLVSGAVPYEQIKKEIDAVLNK
ncbi:MAG: DsbA family protein [Patescibacteria group bacterium]